MDGSVLGSAAKPFGVVKIFRKVGSSRAPAGPEKKTKNAVSFAVVTLFLTAPKKHQNIFETAEVICSSTWLQTGSTPTTSTASTATSMGPRDGRSAREHMIWAHFEF